MPLFQVFGEVTREVICMVEANSADDARLHFERMQGDIDLVYGPICAVTVHKTLVLEPGPELQKGE